MAFATPAQPFKMSMPRASRGGRQRLSERGDLWPASTLAGQAGRRQGWSA